VTERVADLLCRNDAVGDDEFIDGGFQIGHG
jgi:hypothetical protein